jgi:ADP-dependent NAD(P)H-hydrate dehydratase / NAD(P)H-hydrate epimerase
MEQIDASILKKLKRPDERSHKGKNGRILVIAGSEKYHGALLLALQTTSRIVDMVYVHSSDNNLPLIQHLKSEISTFISIGKNSLKETIEIVDSILIGPGLPENGDTISLVHGILQDYPEKKIIVDATALWHVNPKSLHANTIVTPHSREFQNVFGCEPNAQNTKKMAEQYGCTVVLKGKHDYVSYKKNIWENKTGNVGMTKGGTGDVVAGTIAALAATNDCLTSALAGIYLTGLAGDRLHDSVGTFYNTEDVIKEFGKVWKEFIYV